MLWTALRDAGARLDPKLAKLGFIFLLVGYGTKVGLAPMHTWLPDAHSQAPAPVSSIFSAGMLSTVLYCLMRYQPVVDAATGGAAFTSRLLCLFGAVSMIIAAAFILFQRDVKRMLAYCSVEHMGIVAIGLGLGGLGVFAALFHTLNHSLAKSTSFFSAGRLGQMAGSNQMMRLRGITRLSPLWGTGLALSLLALIGVVPSAIFMSELLIVKAAIDAHATADPGRLPGGRRHRLPRHVRPHHEHGARRSRRVLQAHPRQPHRVDARRRSGGAAGPPRALDARPAARRARAGRGHREAGTMTGYFLSDGVCRLGDLPTHEPDDFHAAVVAACQAGARLVALPVLDGGRTLLAVLAA